MWLAKWFGRRKEEEETDEPARFPSLAARVPEQPARTTVSKPKTRSEGFDPYNSGAFERRSAWERVSKR